MESIATTETQRRITVLSKDFNISKFHIGEVNHVHLIKERKNFSRREVTYDGCILTLKSSSVLKGISRLSPSIMGVVNPCIVSNFIVDDDLLKVLSDIDEKIAETFPPHLKHLQKSLYKSTFCLHKRTFCSSISNNVNLPRSEYLSQPSWDFHDIYETVESMELLHELTNAENTRVIVEMDDFQVEKLSLGVKVLHDTPILYNNFPLILKSLWHLFSNGTSCKIINFRVDDESTFLDVLEGLDSFAKTVEKLTHKQFCKAKSINMGLVDGLIIPEKDCYVIVYFRVSILEECNGSTQIFCKLVELKDVTTVTTVKTH